MPPRPPPGNTAGLIDEARKVALVSARSCGQHHTTANLVVTSPNPPGSTWLGPCPGLRLVPSPAPRGGTAGLGQRSLAGRGRRKGVRQPRGRGSCGDKERGAARGPPPAAPRSSSGQGLRPRRPRRGGCGAAMPGCSCRWSPAPGSASRRGGGSCGGEQSPRNRIPQPRRGEAVAREGRGAGMAG